LLYKLHRIGGKKHPFLTPLPVFTLNLEIRSSNSYHSKIIYVTFLPCLTYDKQAASICCLVPDHSSCYISIIVYEACLCWEFGDNFSSAIQLNLFYRRVLNTGLLKIFCNAKKSSCGGTPDLFKRYFAFLAQKVDSLCELCLSVFPTYNNYTN